MKFQVKNEPQIIALNKSQLLCYVNDLKNHILSKKDISDEATLLKVLISLPFQYEMILKNKIFHNKSSIIDAFKKLNPPRTIYINSYFKENIEFLNSMLKTIDEPV